VAQEPDLNPQLARSRFCPACGDEATIDHPRSLSCESCGFISYSNPKPVACVIPLEEDGSVWLLRRGFDPGAGLWTFPGGFVDLGESAEEAARREVMEELEVEVELGPLHGVYSRPDDRILLVVYTGRLLGEPSLTEEAVEVRAFGRHEIPWDEMAFWSTEVALGDLGLTRR